MTDRLVPAFAALADPVRLQLVTRLMQGEATVTELAAPFDISQPAISRHLKVLEEAGLIETRVQGTARPRRLRPETVEALWDWLSGVRAVWQDRFDRLDGVLAGMTAAEAQGSAPDPIPPPDPERKDA